MPFGIVSTIVLVFWPMRVREYRMADGGVRNPKRTPVDTPLGTSANKGKKKGRGCY
jgi:hypothetical protein